MSENGINQRMWHRVGRSGKVLTLLGGGFVDLNVLKQCLEVFPDLIAADGGANIAQKANVIPTQVIGDLDSLDAQVRAAIPPENLKFVDDQDSTDFEKCLQIVKADMIFAFGFLGGRLDHGLAALNALVKYPEQRCILIGAEDICFLAPLDFHITLPDHTRFSLFPMGEAEGRSTGLAYPIDGLKMSPATRIGTSNEVTGPVQLTFAQRNMLVILPLGCLEQTVNALTSS